MSAETIARWNAIPMERTEVGPAQSLKRPRDDDAMDESDDDVSLVSRSPSPPPPNAMDIDKYDEYVGGTEREVVTVETKIKSTNKGFAMLAKLGWVEGQPLGLSGDGRVDPIPFYVKNDLTGLGKSSQDVRVIESTVSQRRGLDSERQTKESEEQRKIREDAVARKAALQSEIASTLRAFYCELCDKQFQNVAQFDEHTNSYAHHHKARFRDMQISLRASANAKEEIDKRKEKERKREEKELKKLAKAAGIKMAKPPAILTPQPTSTPPPVTGESEAKSSGFKKSGWATVGSTSSPAQTQVVPPPIEPASTGFKKSRWSSVGPSSSSANELTPTSTSGGWNTVAREPTSQPPPTPSVPAPPPPENTSHFGPAPAFRTGGWTSLDTGSSLPNPPSNAPSAPSSHLPPSLPSNPRQSGWAPVPTAGPLPPQGQLTTGSSSWSNPTLASPAQPPAAAVRQESSRSGWQQFRAGAPGRRR